MITNFEYNDIVLHCKGWYQKDDNLLEDLGYLFSQIYGWTPKTEADIAPMMLKVLDKLNSEMGKSVSLYQVYNEIHNRVNIQEVSNDMAIILYVRAILQGLSKDEIQLNPPHYGKKEHFRMGSLFGKTPISMTYTEMNRRAQRMFNNKSK